MLYIDRLILMDLLHVVYWDVDIDNDIDIDIARLILKDLLCHWRQHSWLGMSRMRMLTSSWFCVEQFCGKFVGGNIITFLLHYIGTLHYITLVLRRTILQKICWREHYMGWGSMGGWNERRKDARKEKEKEKFSTFGGEREKGKTFLN